MDLGKLLAVNSGGKPHVTPCQTYSRLMQLFSFKKAGESDLDVDVQT